MQRLMPDNYGHYEGHISRAASRQARTGAGSRECDTYPIDISITWQANTSPCKLPRAPFAVPTTQSQSQFPVALSGGVRVECAAHKIIMEGEATKNRNRNRNQNAKCTQIYCTKKKKTLITTTTANEVKQNLRPSRRCEC